MAAPSTKFVAIPPPSAAVTSKAIVSMRQQLPPNPQIQVLSTYNGTFDRKRTLEGALIHLTGAVAAIPCVQCAAHSDKETPFTQCKSNNSFIKGACSSCVFSGDSTYCSLQSNNHGFITKAGLDRRQDPQIVNVLVQRAGAMQNTWHNNCLANGHLQYLINFSEEIIKSLVLPKRQSDVRNGFVSNCTILTAAADSAEPVGVFTLQNAVTAANGILRQVYQKGYCDEKYDFVEREAVTLKYKLVNERTMAWKIIKTHPVYKILLDTEQKTQLRKATGLFFDRRYTFMVGKIVDFDLSLRTIDSDDGIILELPDDYQPATDIEEWLEDVEEPTMDDEALWELNKENWERFMYG